MLLTLQLKASVLCVDVKAVGGSYSQGGPSFDSSCLYQVSDSSVKWLSVYAIYLLSTLWFIL